VATKWCAGVIATRPDAQCQRMTGNRPAVDRPMLGRIGSNGLRCYPFSALNRTFGSDATGPPIWTRWNEGKGGCALIGTPS
jgi:hypothetical protein